MEKFTVRELMFRNPVTININDTLYHAMKIIMGNDVGSVVVIDQEKPVNIVTKRDIIHALCNRPSQLILQELIVLPDKKNQLITIKDKDSIFNAINKFQRNDIKHLPVINSDGKLVGILSCNDLLKRMNYIAMIDSLTQLYNRRYLELINFKFKNKCLSYSLLMLDIDDFKKVNDNYGHDFGDLVLKKLGRIIQENIRIYDDPIRYGGEEFLVLLYRANLDEAKYIAERIRSSFKFVQYDQYPDLQITISIGIATCKENETFGELITRSDRALYLAKKSGKNVVKY